MRALLGCVIASTLFVDASVAAQDLGHRLVGTQGLYAGRQREPGLYVADQLVYYGADTLRDREGDEVPLEALRIDALGNALGLSVVLEIPGASTYVTMTAAVPLARASVSSDRPEASVDRFGLGDVFLQPFLFGWRAPHLDVVAGYAVYLPTGIFRLGEGNLSRGHVTHQLSLGGSVYADEERRWFVSAMASYDLNQAKEGIDIRRGDTLTIQGGAGATLFGLVDVGVVGAALWQVRDDAGIDVPAALRGARDRVYALGGEIAVALPALQGRVGARYVREVGVRSRSEGHVLVFQLALLVWSPEPRNRPEDERNGR